ncbi:hypothetical protein ACWIWK_05650 [Helicobacter sp. 23-1048]
MRFCKKLQSTLFILLLANFGIISVAFGLDTDSLRQKRDIINGSFVKQTHTDMLYSNTIYEGKGRISGVLVWRTGVIADMEGWGFRELLFVPDRNSVFNDDYLKFTLCRSDDEKHSTKHHCLNDNINAELSHALGKNWLEKYALSDFMVRAEVDIANHKNFMTDWIEGGIDYVDFKDLKLHYDIHIDYWQNNINQLFENPLAEPKIMIKILRYASKDSYINLRESPNGKILYAIQKNEVATYKKTPDEEFGILFCKMTESSANKGRIVFLGNDSANPKWYKVAYIPPNAKDTREAIYGVIHSSQVGFECGE